MFVKQSIPTSKPCSLIWQTSGGKKSTAGKTVKQTPKAAAAAGLSATVGTPAGDEADDGLASKTSAVATDQDAAATETKEKKGRTKGDSLYYRVKCRDNGVGMPHEKVGGRWMVAGERWKALQGAKGDRWRGGWLKVKGGWCTVEDECRRKVKGGWRMVKGER